MPINTFAKVGEFGFCTTYCEPYTDYTYINDGTGHYHVASYVVDGEGQAESRPTSDNSGAPGYVQELKKGNLYLLKAPTDVDVFGPHGHDGRGVWVRTTTEDTGMLQVLFNPIPEERKLEFEVVKGKDIQSIKVTAEEKRKTIVCVQSYVMAKDKRIDSGQFAKVLPGNSVDVELSTGSVIIIVTSERMGIDEKMGLK